MRGIIIEIDVKTLGHVRDVMQESSEDCDAPNTYGRLRLWADFLTALIARAIPKHCPAVAGPARGKGKGKGKANPQHPLGK